MKQNEIIAAVNALHCPEAVALPMVYEVWEDGEITLTKGGELYGQRRLHVDAFGDAMLALPPSSLAVKTPGEEHSRIVARDHTDALAARKLILGESA